MAVSEIKPIASPVEKAHEIGQQLADEWLKGKHEYVLATHVDKDHIIIILSCFVDHHACRSNKLTYRELQEIGDKICAENCLSYLRHKARA